MKLINPSYEILEQGVGLQGIYEQIERVGKTCYKSEVKGGESAKKFVEKMIANQHYAMLEHGTVYLKSEGIVRAFGRGYQGGMKYLNNPYSRVNIEGTTQYVTTNLRVLVENGWMDDLRYYLCEPTQWHVKRVTVKFISNIHFYKDITRHRTMSFAIESTRYCNYASEQKFGRCIKFIRPVWLKPEEEEEFIRDCETCEEIYFRWIEKYGWQAQQSAEFLCQDTAAEICMTGFVDSTGWIHVFNLRALDKTGPAHPTVKQLMVPLYEEFCQRGYINNSN